MDGMALLLSTSADASPNDPRCGMNRTETGDAETFDRAAQRALGAGKNPPRGAGFHRFERNSLPPRSRCAVRLPETRHRQAGGPFKRRILDGGSA
jgi:hypothetical protein